MKTGTTPAAGQVLVASATRDGNRLIGVVMGSEDRYADMRPLLLHGFADWSWLRLDQFAPGSIPAADR